jgi:hypothetical protein
MCESCSGAGVQGYVEAAQMFEGESGTRPGVDLAAITERMHIRKAVQSGDIEAAIEAANDLDPQVIFRRLCRNRCIANQHVHTAFSSPGS